MSTGAGRGFGTPGYGTAMLSLLALLSSAVWGTSDFFAGLKARSMAPAAVVAVTQAFALVALSIIRLVRHQGLAPAFSGNGAVWAGVAGAAGAAGLVCFYTALATGTMGVVAPISSLGALVPVLLGLLTGEHPSTTAWVGMALAVTGAALASGPELAGAVPPRPVILAAAAAGFFGIALFSLDRGARYALLETLWGMRLTSVVLFLVAGHWPGRRHRERPLRVCLITRHGQHCQRPRVAVPGGNTLLGAAASGRAPPPCSGNRRRPDFGGSALDRGLTRCPSVGGSARDELPEQPP